MIGADAVRFTTQAATAGVLLAGTAHVWQLALFQGIAGAAGGFFNPASTALVPRTISPARLQQANALLSISQSGTNIFGPALSGVIVAFAGSGAVFAIDAASFLFSIACLAALQVDEPRRERTSRFWQDVGDGYREVRRVRWLTAGFLGFALGNVGIGIFFVLGPVIARQHLGGAAAWGAIVSAGAVGGLVGGLTSYRIRPARPVATAFLIWAVGSLPAFALIRPFPLVAVMAANVVFGLGIVVGNTLWETSMQQEVHPDKLARVGSIDWLLSLCLMPFGQAIAGPLAGAFGVRAIILASGLLMSVPSLCVVAFVRDVREVRRAPRADTALAG
jgi:MFS family permease